ncbi:guanitoxin biosynthesis heme-dependent pre-guanitoxin N-hydroxylase GntA [Aequorivita lipolytica]|uniref:YqcI/YcgG family protein n=1 Tax=Aequorivita lipolytica TaxID=153267 RepID=A0A5C6YN45_9FLAO|nr:guanitoxin biosynthesis heme-dependent pre-guanitoxin N-hydroxylase GntA [Aequorivita lipolytica]TXD68292.1 YqcI/YcgG family protein [Aequorivita lipolytica]SRX53438.1 hypothetical protein AEQU2_02669 [Aequorivita lipolytica]
MKTSPILDKPSLIAQFKDFILKKSHPCIMAQTVFKMDEYSIKEYNSLGSKETAAEILKDLRNYIDKYDFTSNNFETFIAIFPSENFEDEITFEKALWSQLKTINELDSTPWDSSVANDPTSTKFSFSILGTAFYIVGLHPNSSRKARQAPYPALVFNLHLQFEKLREMGTYQRVKNRIRKRDIKLQGSVNPVLKDFGEASEALQYSGRNVGENWKCPFHQN